MYKWQVQTKQSLRISIMPWIWSSICELADKILLHVFNVYKFFDFVWITS